MRELRFLQRKVLQFVVISLSLAYSLGVYLLHHTHFRIYIRSLSGFVLVPLEYFLPCLISVLLSASSLLACFGVDLSVVLYSVGHFSLV